MVNMQTPSTPTRTHPLERLVRREGEVWETTDEGEREAEEIHFQLDRHQRHTFRDHIIEHLNPNDELPHAELSNYHSQLSQIIHEYAGFDYIVARILFRAVQCERYHEAVQKLSLIHERKIKNIPYAIRTLGIKKYEDALDLMYKLAEDFRLEVKDFKLCSLDFLNEK